MFIFLLKLIRGDWFILQLPGLDSRLWGKVKSDPCSSISDYSRYVLSMVQSRNTRDQVVERTFKALLASICKNSTGQKKTHGQAQYQLIE